MGLATRDRTRRGRLRLAAALALAVPLLSIPAADAATWTDVSRGPVSGGTVVPVMDYFGGVTVWSELVPGDRAGPSEYRLVASTPDGTRVLPVAPRRDAPFDVDLGRNEEGSIVAAYSRCTGTYPRSRFSATAPYPAWTDGRDCDVYVFDFERMRESRPVGVNTAASEVLPSVSLATIAFVRVSPGARRPGVPRVHVRPGVHPVVRLPGGPPGRARRGVPTRLDLHASRLAFVWNRRSGRGRSPGYVTELRMDTLDGGHRTIGRAISDRRHPGYASFIGPTATRSTVYSGFQRALVGEGEDRSRAALLLRYDVRSRRRSRADAPPFLVDASMFGQEVVIGVSPQNFTVFDPPARFLLALDVSWRPY